MIQVKDIAQQLSTLLKKYETFQGLYLYGSQVKGTATSCSDIDIALVLRERPDYKTKDRIVSDILALELDREVIIDYKFTTPQELDFNDFYFNELKKGLYYGV